MAPDDNVAEVLVMDFEKLADAEKECEWAQELQMKKDPNRIDVSLQDSDKKLLVDITNGNQQTVVPPSMRQRVFQEVHGFSHFNSRHTASEVA